MQLPVSIKPQDKDCQAYDNTVFFSVAKQYIVVFLDCRRMYWSDCSNPATIQSARILDGGDRQTLVTDSGPECIVDLVIDFDSTHASLIVNARLRPTIRDRSRSRYVGLQLLPIKYRRITGG